MGLWPPLQSCAQYPRLLFCTKTQAQRPSYDALLQRRAKGHAGPRSAAALKLGGSEGPPPCPWDHGTPRSPQPLTYCCDTWDEELRGLRVLKTIPGFPFVLHDYN